MEETIRFELNDKKTEMLLDPNLTVGLHLKNPEPSSQDIVNVMEGNLYRCGSHVRINGAIQTEGKEMKGGK